MSKHDGTEQYTREDWFIDDDCAPWWRIILSYVIAAALIGAILALSIVDAFAVPQKSPPPAEQEDQNEVRIGVMCGTLKGAGAVVIVDPVQQKVYKFDFVCPVGKAV
jgi:hypothetical protein